ncbi:MAG: DNA-processing protein DprA [Coriobacteriaceae bacterium]|nr:DNA-processing protein DprA [Coriobacteriaceae bacterium]
MSSSRTERTEIYCEDPAFPPMVRELPSCPARLYVRGDERVLLEPCFSIIGSRRATPYGIALAQMAATIAAESGIVVVSGAARGCDSAAGRAALAAGGRHVAVVGTGADVVYPKSSEGLIADTLSSGGAVVSLERWGSPPTRYAFPKRNRVIASLSRATFVSEAGMPSGTFTTAECATALDREVLCAPGSILSPDSKGCNYLISNGATCIIDEESLEVAISRIYGVLRFSHVAPRVKLGETSREQEAMHALVAQPLRIEELAAHLRIDAQDALMLVSSLQVQGLVERLHDGRLAPTTIALHAIGGICHNG